ncbi:hypothetical protein LTR62_001243 [Meristemomyces frigidus]|uniref:Uncharacterized protein n=1 Tax=Meristemomyces frigidus TaxID=1508187 RepID=A0AAN7YIF0_9PEZI|nr:hypothetical protein LTR62_001243 [Meristemomyces frigidus]
MESGDEEKALQLNCGLHRRMSLLSSPISSPRSTSPKDELYTPTEPVSSAPTTIVLGLWPYATEEQIRYYVQGYEALYPAARLLFLHYSPSYDQHIGDALDHLTASHANRPLDAPANILLHLFSGCGAAQGCALLRTYKLRTGHRLPVQAVIMDSLPTIHIPTYAAAGRSPRLVLSFLYTLLTMLLVRIIATLNYFHFEQKRKQHRHDLNNPYLIPPQARKCYIFETKDLMFSWHDTVAEHLRGDEECVLRDDMNVKRTSVDDRGKLSGDQERYWEGIDNCWTGHGS